MTTATTSLFNGLDVEALQAAISGVAAEQSAGQLGFAVRTQWLGGTKAQSSVDQWTIAGEQRPRGFTIHADEPAELCGTNTAPNPQELLMAAVNSCIMVGLVVECCRRGITLRSVSLETSGTLNLAGFFGLDATVKPGYEEVAVAVTIDAAAPEADIRAACEAALSRSPNRWNLAMPIAVKPSLTIAGR